MQIQLSNVSRRRTRWRYGVVALAAAAMSLSLLLIWGFTGTNAVHLCGWNALLQCDQGTRLFWLVPITVAAVSAFSAFLLVRWANRDMKVGPGLALAGWVLTLLPTILELRPRTFGPSELIAAGIWGSVGIALLAWGAMSLAAGHNRSVRIATLLLWVGFITTLQAMPGVMEHALRN